MAVLKKIIYSVLGVILLTSLIVALFLFQTKKGYEYRKEIGGSFLSSQHPQYAKYVLSQNDINAMLDLIYAPPAVNSKFTENTASGDTLSVFLAGGASNQSAPRKPLIQIETIDDPNFTAKIMKVSDPTTIHLVATRLKDKGQPLSELIDQNRAVGGINASGFDDANGNGSGGKVVGIAIGDGQILDTDMKKDKQMLIGGFTQSGKFITGFYSINELFEKGVTQAVSFGPQLIVDGSDVVTTEVNNAFGFAPRTAIGQAADNSVIMVVTDGRFYTNKMHRGASMTDLAKIFKKYDAINAYALDGGGSSTMIYEGNLMLQPATNTKAGMRYLPNAFVVIPNNK